MQNHTKKLTLDDLEIRYRNIRNSNPNVKKCTVTGCPNPRDSTELVGEDTSCAYHRLLFDFWSCEVCTPDQTNHYIVCQKGRRRAFTNWRNRTGKEALDRIVLKMALEPINWKC
jgi:hypothetical protein